MTTKRNLSKKKIASQNISISPYLKDLLKRFVKERHDNDPKDEKFQSVSSFCTFAIETVLKILNKGKSVKDLENFNQTASTSFFQRNMFQAFIPLYEWAIELNRYRYENLITFTEMIDKLIRYILSQDKSNLNKLPKMAKKIYKLVGNKTITKQINFDIKGTQLIAEYEGYRQNIHHEHTKVIITIASFLGLKITKLDKYQNYTKIWFEIDKNHLKNFGLKPDKSKFTEILRSNMSYFLNYYYIVNDDEAHLWIDLSSKDDLYVSFKQKASGSQFVNSIIKEIRKIASNKDLKRSILKLFESLHWITIYDKEELIFEISLPENSKVERSIIEKGIKSIGSIVPIQKKLQLK
ncbi:MAG: hypothetical protein GF353_25565 [Candidatus Lokiarchaeota archaeon]|nr:hypothetical protein [Candidatus Lokiarchaeota archaeon]